MKYISLFAETESGLSLVGGKGANLSELVRAGFQVPSGFIVTTDAYRAFVQANQFQSHILDLVHSISPADPAALEKSSAEIRMLFEQGTLPTEIGGAITVAYHTLAGSQVSASSNLAVAVRSSATTEDLPGLAFAGQQDTYLNVRGEETLLQAVMRCWASLWTARAMAYRARNGIAPDEIALAVVVQQMIASEASGVLFTANPVTGRRDEMVIEASFGLGEAIVSGEVDPDHYVVVPDSWKIAERKLGSKEIAILPVAEGGTEKIERHGEPVQALPDGPIVELAHVAKRVADHFGSPQDIEWAWANGQLYLLQARPITSLYPLPDNLKPDEGLRVLINFNAIQGVMDPLTPIGIDALRLTLAGVPRILHLQVSMREILLEAGDRLFLDFTSLVRDPSLRNIVLNFLAQTDPASLQILLRLIDEGRIAERRILTRWQALKLLIAAFPLLRRILAALVAPDQVRPRVIARAEKFITRTQEHAAAAGNLYELLHAMENDLSAAEDISINAMPTVLPAFIAIPIVDRWLVQWLGEKQGAALELMRGLPGNLTIAMDLKLWATAQAIRKDSAACEWMRARPIPELLGAYRHGALPSTAQRVLDEFLQEYGMRGNAEIDLGRPRWRDNPTPILQTLLGYLQVADPERAPDVVYRRAGKQAEHLVGEYVARLRRTRLGWLRGRLFAAAIRRMRLLAGLREAPLFYLVRVNDIYRVALLAAARDLTAKGQLECAEDIFLVSLELLKEFANGEKVDLKKIAAVNRSQYEHEMARKQMPRVLLSTGEAFYEGLSEPASGGNDLIGEAVSPGVVEGRAHVMSDPHEAHLEPGEILVCPSTDPGWTPLFLTAGGLVMEIGGMITHGSVVAREYGIPAVVGVHHATTRLQTGQRVRVDGNRGRVTVLE